MARKKRKKAAKAAAAPKLSQHDAARGNYQRNAAVNAAAKKARKAEKPE